MNNAGLALGRAPVVESEEDDDRTMLETNVLGLMRMTKLVYPHMQPGRGHIVNLGSWAGREAYRFGSGYVVSKWGVRVLTEMLRKELVGEIHVTTVDPGMVGDTEFSDVRFKGDVDKKEAVYAGCEVRHAGRRRGLHRLRRHAAGAREHRRDRPQAPPTGEPGAHRPGRVETA